MSRNHIKIKLISPIFLLILLIVTSAFCETSINAEVDKASIASGENITYKLTVVSSETNIPVPQRPEFTGFNILSQVESSTVSFVSGKMKSAIVYTYLLEPQTTGKLRIEPAKIKIKNETQSTAVFEIEIKGTEKSIPLPQESQPEPQGGLPEPQEPQTTL